MGKSLRACDEREGMGGFYHDCLVSVACAFYVGEKYEDIGVVTEPAYRGKGMSTMCAAEVCADILSRSHRPSWLVQRIR